MGIDRHLLCVHTIHKWGSLRFEGPPFIQNSYLVIICINPPPFVTWLNPCCFRIR